MGAAAQGSGRRYRMTIAYDGTAYAGWQIQPNGMTVQQRLEEALQSLTGGASAKVHGSGRTDQGVHARAQVAHVDLVTRLTPTALRRALNAILPGDVRVMQARYAAADFHARRSAVGKEYRYFVWNDAIVPPWLRAYRTSVTGSLDIDAMRRAAAELVGTRDFAAFTANPNRVVESTVRDLTRLDILKHGCDVTIVAAGNGFLYKMVRSLAGWLIRVGEGAVDAAETVDVLASRRRTARVPTAPPEGLFLWQVRY